MECPNCGQENRDVALFCQHCGTALVLAEPAVLAEPEETPEPGAEMAQEQAEQAQDLDLETPDTPMLSDTAASDIEPTSEVSGDESEPKAASEPAPVASMPQEAPEGDPGADASSLETPPESMDAPASGQTETELPPDTAQPIETEPAPTVPSADVATTGLELIEGLEPMPDPLALDEEPETVLPDQQPVQPMVEAQELADAHMLPWDTEPTPLQALELGTVLYGRYKIIEVTEKQPTQILYRVRDLQRCPRCGATGHSPDEAFCAACGALMDQKPVAFLLQQSADDYTDPKVIDPEDQFVEGEYNYWVWRENTQEVAMQEEQPLMRLLVGLQSDTGQVRELDEDSMFALTMAFTYESVTHQLGLFIVADGMGGHEGGEIASRLAIQTTAQILLRDLFGPELAGTALAPEEILDRIANAVRQANDEVYLERQKRDNDMGTTLTAAFVKDWTLHVGHVGDCRAYRWGEEGLQQLTTDHSIVAGMVAAGTILPEEIYTHPQRSVIYRCIGDQPTVEVDTGTLQLAPGERLLVCCDGLWEMLRSEGIEDILLAEADPQSACDQMVHQANLAGGSDNISVIIVQL